MNRKALIFGLFTLTIHVAAFGQSYSLDWRTIDGGGGLSTGTGFELKGTIGQPDAGVMSGGTFALTGGFWPVTQSCSCPGDLNHDGLLNGGDVQQFVNCILTGGTCSCADLNATGGPTIDDVPIFVTWLLNEHVCGS